MKKSSASLLKIGVDLGGTNVRAGLVNSERILNLKLKAVRSRGTKEEILADLCEVIDAVMTTKVKGIGLGVPSLLDPKTGVLYHVTNLPALQNVPLKKYLEIKYKVEVAIDNDANCFAMGELRFGKSAKSKNFVGLILGTGLGAGIISNGKLLSGQSCGAGEFGMFPYLDSTLEAYASGQFFRRYNLSGQELSDLAQKGDSKALGIFDEYGRHLGEGIKLILYSLAPEEIILGGSVSRAFPYFKKSMLENLDSFSIPEVGKKLKVKVSKTKEIAILGAAGLIDNLR